jgi:porin
MKRRLACVAVGASSVFLAAGAWAEETERPLRLSLSYVADVMGVVDGGLQQRGRFLDNLSAAADANLEALLGWKGATAHVDVLNNAGGAPNEDAGTLQGVDNIEVTRQRVRLFEAWVEQSWRSSSLRVGLYDLNSEFYANESAAHLIGPAFGIGSEIAATGPNGPSIFPSTAIGVRYSIGSDAGRYFRTALLNADAGVPGDPGGANVSFDAGALLIAEGGVEGDGAKFAVGAWRYTSRQDDIRDLDGSGNPLKRTAQGAYLVYERPLNDPEAVRASSFFLRAGLSDGDTTPFSGGWQSGMLVKRAIPSRPESVFSIGLNQGVLSRGHRDNQRDLGVAMDDTEMQLEVTYSDKILPNLTLQPDLQWIPNPGGDRSIKDALVVGLRLSLEL